MTAVTVKPVPLGEALQHLAAIMSHIEESEGEVIDDLLPQFEQGMANVQAAIDRRIGLLRTIPPAVEMMKGEVARLRDQIARLEAVAERLKATTKAHMEEIGVQRFEGTIGRFQLVKAGGVQAVDLRVATYAQENCVVEGDIALVPPQYLQKRTVWVLDKAKLADDLRTGAYDFNDASIDPVSGMTYLPYAVLHPRGTYVRIY
jgi:hypothetical protein